MTDDIQNPAPCSPLAILPEPETSHRAALTAETLARVLAPMDEGATLPAMNAALEESLTLDADGEAVLFAQAQILDALFHRLVDNSIGLTTLSGKHKPEYISQNTLLVALRAQHQTRTALDALSKIRTRKAFCPTSPEEVTGEATDA